MAKKIQSSSVSKEQLLAVIVAIEFACKMLIALIPILKNLIGQFEAMEK